MAETDDAFFAPSGTGGPYIVLRQYTQHAAPCHTCNDCGSRRAQCDDREGNLVRVPPACRCKPAQFDGEPLDEHEAEPEVRHGKAEQSDDHQCDIRKGVLSCCGNDTDQKPEYDCENSAVDRKST